jgi:putative DNA primase/helicase
MALHENASSLAAGATPAQFDAHIIDYYAWHNRVLASLRDSGSVFQNIFFELRCLQRWVCWRLVKRENAKPTKVPFNARTGKLASVTNPDDWCDFETAVAASINYSGIGFCFFKQDGFCGIDLDVKPGEQLSAEQIKIYQAFNSYSELSPSGRGLHIIVKAKLPGKGRRRDDVEIYDDSRFFTMTGNVYRGA